MKVVSFIVVSFILAFRNIFSMAYGAVLLYTYYVPSVTMYVVVAIFTLMRIFIPSRASRIEMASMQEAARVRAEAEKEIVNSNGQEQ